jgi:hypothetical protein
VRRRLDLISQLQFFALAAFRVSLFEIRVRRSTFGRVPPPYAFNFPSAPRDAEQETKLQARAQGRRPASSALSSRKGAGAEQLTIL